MEKLNLNETPVRTSNNFKINNIEIEKKLIPEDIRDFTNVKIEGKGNYDSNVSDSELIYGLGKDFTNGRKNISLRIVPEGKMKVEFSLSKAEKNLAENVEIIAEENTNTDVLIEYKSDENIAGFHNGVIRLKAKKNSNINVGIINLLGKEANNFISIQNELDENANVNYNIVDFGGERSITNLYSDIRGELAENNINAMYLGRDNQVFDINYIAHLKGERTKINIDVVGALKDYAKKHFKGTIDFKQGCKKAVGEESEECMLLSDTAKSIALPMLLCSEEDVEGNHASSAGKIGEKELFYVMSRGFSQKEAMKLMVRAKFNKMLEWMDDELRAEIENEINKRLD